MDIATFIGIIASFMLLIIAIMMGSSLLVFIDIPSALIVVGGTICATMINYPLKDVIRTVNVVKNAFFAKSLTFGEIIANFVNFANKARKEGILALESSLPEISDEFLKKGLQLTIDGLEPQAINEIMETEIAFIEDRHRLGAELFQTMGTFAPAFGMIGTLIGLVQMLQSMDDPGSIGPAMAVALITTFYGAVMANVLFLPISGKLKTRSKEESLVKEMIIQGIMSLSRGDNPRIIEQKLHSFLPPNLRVSAFK
ncbi:MAG: motility protein A [Proteobacteria bacterium]|nr:motility protein A [Pseudomonadota bacterium]